MSSGLILALIVGFVAGVAARLLVPGREHPGGIFLTVLLGIAGSLTCWLLGRGLGWYNHGELRGLVISSAGAVLLLAIHRAMTEKGTAF